jgi:hypothetical protein
MSEQEPDVETIDLSVRQAIDEMVAGGLSSDEAHGRMRDAVRSFNCDHRREPDTAHASRCSRCKCVKISDAFAYFGIDRQDT